MFVAMSRHWPQNFTGHVREFASIWLIKIRGAKMKISSLAAVLALGCLPAVANASIITDGNVSLGVDLFGQLNVGGGVPDVVGQTAVGVRWIAPGGVQYESTSHGCLCEGWGVLVDGAAGFANNSSGSGGLTSLSFADTATTATSVVQVNTTDVTVTHSFALATETPDLYRVHVTIANTGATDVASVTYRRSMDWDASPTPFNEYVTIAGTATTTLLAHSSNDGFVTDDISASGLGDIAGCGVDTDFTACGPSDHGAAFDFLLGGLLAGESYSFDIFYGGAANKREALAALGAVGAELYSMGWSGSDATQSGTDGAGNLTPTYIFAFRGVGGTVIVPPPSAIPVPAAGFLLFGAIGALGAFKRRKSA
ncbi:MAG: VPLPA-CTERM sorting domain-containing protein [Cypionkella sp.]